MIGTLFNYSQQFFKSYFHHVFWIIVILFLFFMYLSGSFKSLAQDFKKYIPQMIVIFAIVFLSSLFFVPISQTIYYDTHNYVLHSYNVRFQNISGQCTTKIDGVCEDYGILPHGLGLSSVLAIFIFSKNLTFLLDYLSIIILLFYSFAIILNFLIFMRLTSRRVLSFLLAITLGLLPFNLKFSRTITPEIVSFLVLSLLAYLLLLFVNMTQDNSSKQKSSSLASIFLSLIILILLRVEYWIIFFAFVVFIFSYMILFKSNFRNLILYELFKLKNVLLFGITFIYTLFYSFFFMYQKLVIANESRIGSNFLNISYLTYDNNPIMICLHILFVLAVLFVLKRLYLISSSRNELEFVSKKNFSSKSSIHPNQKFNANSIAFFIFPLLTYFFIVLFLSFYNYLSVFRYMVPVSGFLILSLIPFFQAIKNGFGFSKSRLCKMIPYLVTIIILILSLFYAFQLRNESEVIYETEIFLDTINSNNLYDRLNYSLQDIFFFRGGYLGEFGGLESYTSSESLIYPLIKSGRSVYYIDSFFESVNQSPFWASSQYRIIFENRTDFYNQGHIENGSVDDTFIDDNIDDDHIDDEFIIDLSSKYSAQNNSLFKIYKLVLLEN